MSKACPGEKGKGPSCEACIHSKQPQLARLCAHTGSGKVFCDKAPVPRPACTGESIGLNVAECSGWVELYDSLGGPDWPKTFSQGCDGRLDPCGCAASWQKSIKCQGLRDYKSITELYLLVLTSRARFQPPFPPSPSFRRSPWLRQRSRAPCQEASPICKS